MRKKPNFSFSLPANVSQAFDEMMGQFPEKRRWAALSAALLLYLDLSPKMQNAWSNRVYSADLIEGELDRMIKGASNRSKAAQDAEKAAAEAFQAHIAAVKARLTPPPATKPAAG